MADDRDRRKPLTPPKGVASQIARPIPGVPGVIRPPVSKTPISDPPESWEDGSTGVVAKDPTAHESPTEILLRRSGETKNLMAVTKAVAVRTADEISKLEDSVASAHEKIEAVFPVLQDLAETFQKQNETLKAELDHQRDQNTMILGMLVQREHVRARTASADIALDRARQETAIELRKEKWKAIWAWVGKGSALVSVIAAVVTAILGARGC